MIKRFFNNLLLNDKKKLILGYPFLSYLQVNVNANTEINSNQGGLNWFDQDYIYTESLFYLNIYHYY